MNKDQEVLETKFKAEGVQNIITKDGTVYSSVLSAMGQQSVEYGKWLHNNEWVWLPNKQRYCNINKPLVYFTPQEVYNEFNNQN